MHPQNKISKFIASYKLSCALFLMLLLLTYLGTMYQVEHGLYQSQQKYFESMFLVHWAYGILPVPLPGGYLVMLLTFINLSWGVWVRFRFKWSKLGIALMHVGILMLLVGAFVSYVFSIHGRMLLYENEVSNEVENTYEWEIGVSEVVAEGAVTEFILKEDDFSGLSGRKSRRFKFANVPFELEISGYTENAALPREPLSASGADLVILPLDKEFQRNMAGARITVHDLTDGSAQKAVIWAGHTAPTVVDAGGRRWRIGLRRQRIQLPFHIRLDRFTRKLHPGTSIAHEFTSEITKIEDGLHQQFRVTMNEPFRHMGYTFYQSSWGQQAAGSSERLYSVFSVVRNPADQVPLYACIITTLGLVLHYFGKLRTYIKREKARKS